MSFPNDASAAPFVDCVAAAGEASVDVRDDVDDVDVVLVTRDAVVVVDSVSPPTMKLEPVVLMMPDEVGVRAALEVRLPGESSSVHLYTPSPGVHWVPAEQYLPSGQQDSPMSGL